jgi:hypothetical protein
MPAVNLPALGEEKPEEELMGKVITIIVCTK